MLGQNEFTDFKEFLNANRSVNKFCASVQCMRNPRLNSRLATLHFSSTKIDFNRNAAVQINKKQWCFLCDKFTLKQNPSNLYYSEGQWSKEQGCKELALSYILYWCRGIFNNDEYNYYQGVLEKCFWKSHLQIFAAS